MTEDAEHMLVKKLFKLRKAVSKADDALKALKRDYETGVSELIELLRANGKEATAKYEGLGFVSLGKPQLYASYKKDNQDTIFDWVKSLGREEIIKDSIHPATFSSFVSELLAENKPLPEEVSYYLKPNVKFYERG